MDYKSMNKIFNFLKSNIGGSVSLLFILFVIFYLSLSGYKTGLNTKNDEEIIGATSTSDSLWEKQKKDVADGLGWILSGMGEQLTADVEYDIHRDYPNNSLKFEKTDFSSDSEGKYKSIRIGNYRIDFKDYVYPESQEPIGTEMNVLNQDISIISFKKLNGFIHDIFHVDYDGVSYYLIPAWSDGAHCCSYVTPLVYSGGNLKIGKEVAFGNVDFSGFDKTNLFIKDDQVYFSQIDTRFAYFYTCYACSKPMFFISFNKVDINNGNIILANDEFKKYYKKYSDGVDVQIKTVKGYKESYNLEQDETLALDNWFPYIVSRTINDILAGTEEESIWEKYENDMKYFNFSDAEEIKEEIKEEIIDEMNGGDLEREGN